MEGTTLYQCDNCGKTVELPDGEQKLSECCLKPLVSYEDLPPCRTSFTAEHARDDDDYEPCDDGRSGRV